MGLHQLCSECSRLENAHLIIVDNTPRSKAPSALSTQSQVRLFDKSPPVQSTSLQVITCLFQYRSPETCNVVNDTSWHIGDAARVLAKQHLGLVYAEDTVTSSCNTFPKEILAGYSLEKLYASKADCHLCSFLYYRIGEPEWRFQALRGSRSVAVPVLQGPCDDWSKSTNEIALRPLSTFLDSGRKMTLSLMFLTVEDESGSPSEDVFKHRLSRQKLVLQCFPPKVLANKINLNVFSPNDELRYGFRVRTILELQSWLSSCPMHHTVCGREISSGTLTNSRPHPTRLLKLSKGHGREEVDVELIETSSLQDDNQELRYATLSHCWGKKGIPNKLVRSNISLHMRPRPSHVLPKTFDQVVHLCFAIGIEYLWIDALCIIQEDKIEWEYEASRMFHVYAGAVFNVVAAGSSDSSQGLLVQNYHMMPCKISAIWYTSMEETLDLSVSFEDPSYEPQIDSEPLFKRAWVYQERILSKRSIEFGTGQIKWQCRQNIHREAYGNRVNLGAATAFKGLFGAVKDWQSVINNYSRTLLTNSGDKLAAAAGVAQAFTVERGYEPRDYAAGLMLKDRDIMQQLLWVSTSPQSASRLPEVAPTWSWASISLGAICGPSDSNDEPKLHPDIQVTGAKVHSVPDNPFNHTRQGWLQLKALTLCRGEMLDQSLYRKPEDSVAELKDIAYSGQPGWLGLVLGSDKCVVEVLIGQSNRGTPAAYTSLRVELSYKIRWDHRDAAGLMTAGADFCFLALQMNHYPLNMFRKEYKDTYYGLLLIKVEGEKGTYQRLGVLTVNSYCPEITFWGTQGPIGLEDDDLVAEKEKLCRQPEIRII